MKEREGRVNKSVGEIIIISPDESLPVNDCVTDLRAMMCLGFRQSFSRVGVKLKCQKPSNEYINCCHVTVSMGSKLPSLLTCPHYASSE